MNDSTLSVGNSWDIQESQLTSIKKLKWGFDKFAQMSYPNYYSDGSNFSTASSMMLVLWMQYYTKN